MLQLIIKRYRLQNELGGIAGYGSRVRINREDGPLCFGPPNHLAALTLEELAERWFTIFASHLQADANKRLCGEPEGWKELTLEAFVNSSYAFSNQDPTIVLAIEERIRRACVAVCVALLHEWQFDEKEKIVELTVSRPSADITPVAIVDSPKPQS